MMNRFILIGILVCFLIGGFLFWKQMLQRQESNKSIQPSHAKPLPKEVTIMLDKNGFSPVEVTIQVGGAIRWKNISGDKQTVNSDDYPTNQKHKELNFGVFDNNSSVIYIFTKPGIYGYHNQFHPEQKGKVVVK